MESRQPAKTNIQFGADAKSVAMGRYSRNVIVMRSRFWFIASAGLNLILAAALILVAAWRSTRIQEFLTAAAPAPAPGVEIRTEIRTNSVVRYQNITWAQIESTNLDAYITNLKALGCPKTTIRDIVLAEVNQPFARRRVTQIVTTDQEWWKTEPDPAVARAASRQLRELEAERRARLTALLGPDWETETDVDAWVESNYGLTGPRLGTLPPETKRALYDIAAGDPEGGAGRGSRASRRGSATNTWQSDREKLKGWLTPVALNEYLLRYSQTANYLRADTRGVNFQPQQFQDLFTTIDPILLQPDYYYQGSSAELRDRQRALQAQYEAALQKSLGSQTYQALRLNQDPLYISAATAVKQAAIPAQYLTKLYQVGVATQAELDRVRNDTTLTADDKITALSAARVEQQKAIEKLIGAEAFQRWLQTQTLP